MRPIPSLLSAVALAITPTLSLAPSFADAQVLLNIRVGIPPPPLPIYEQPPLPDPDFIWIPGYWSWDDEYGDYYWVPGTWVAAPEPGYLWTPSWWGWESGAYVFHPGYWGPHVGFYGGVDYGFGYTGSGYEGGYWAGGHFFYNTTVTRVTNVGITNIYQKTVAVNPTSRVSFNGGPGGLPAQPSFAEAAALREAHLPPTAAQMQQVQAAHADRALYATANHGAPPVAASAAPGRLSGPGVVRSEAWQRGPVGPQEPRSPSAPRLGEGRPASPGSPSNGAGGRPENAYAPSGSNGSAPSAHPPPAARSAPPPKPAPRPAAERKEPKDEHRDH